MGSFLEEIIKGGLGNVFGNAGGSTSGGGLEDILKDMTGGQSTTTTSTTTTRRSTQDNDLNDILRDIRQNAGASGSAPQRTTTQQVDDTTQGSCSARDSIWATSAKSPRVCSKPSDWPVAL